MLWKNAFDATENVPVGRRMVEVRIQEFQEQLVISIDNSCNNDIVIIDNLPQASRTGHGLQTKEHSIHRQKCMEEWPFSR